MNLCCIEADVMPDVSVQYLLQYFKVCLKPSWLKVPGCVLVPPLLSRIHLLWLVWAWVQPNIPECTLTETQTHWQRRARKILSKFCSITVSVTQKKTNFYDVFRQEWWRLNFKYLLSSSRYCLIAKLLQSFWRCPSSPLWQPAVRWPGGR